MRIQKYPNDSAISSDKKIAIGSNFNIGSDVVLECGEVSIGDNVSIGVPGENGFRFPGGVRIRADKLILGSNVRISRHVMIRGGEIRLDRLVEIQPGATVNVTRRLVIGTHGVLNQDCEISGVDVELGRELWMLPQAKIGGGSAFEAHSRLRAGNWCHIGVRSFLNTARPITIGHEVGLGTGTCLYTHGAYPSVLDGKPVAFGPISIGDRTWIPGAIVNPAVSIGADCVIGVGSLVTRDIPSGSLAGGVPAKVIRENAYPKPLGPSERLDFFNEFLRVFSEICGQHSEVVKKLGQTSFSFATDDTLILYVPNLVSLPDQMGCSQLLVLTDGVALQVSQLPAYTTVIDCTAKKIIGRAGVTTERMLNQLRRYGVRFNFEVHDGFYLPWSDDSASSAFSAA